MRKLALWCALVVMPLMAQAQFVLSGHVHDDASGEAVPGAVVHANDQWATVTDADGRYELAVKSGIYRFEVRHLAYHTDSFTVEVSEDRHVDRRLRPKNVTIRAVAVHGAMAPDMQQPAVRVDALERRMTDGVNYHLGAMLSGIAGVSSVTTGSNAGQPVVRGLFGSRVAVIVNGIPQQTQQWGADHGSDLDPWMAERVSVQKGPAVLQYGPNASAGAIIVEPSAMMKSGNLSVGAFMRGQSVNDGIDGGLRIRKRWERLQLEALATVRDYADLRVPADTFVHLNRFLPLYDERMVNTSGRADGQQLRLRYIGQRSSHRLELRRTFNRYGLFPGIFGIPSVPALAGDGAPRETGLPYVTSEHRSASYHLHTRIAGGELDVDAGWQQNVRTENGPPHGHGNAPVPTSTTALDLDLHSFFANTRYLRGFNGDKEAFFTVQIEHRDSRSAGWEFLVNDYRVTAGGVAMGAEGWKFAGGALSVGMRIDFAAIAADEYRENLYDAEQDIIGTRVRSPGVRTPMQNWSANLLWEREVNVHHSWSVQLSRTARFPSAFELSANGIHHGTFRHEQGNPELLPESGYQIDVQWALRYGKFSAALSPFYGYYNNFIYLDPSGRFSPLPDAGQIYLFRQDEVLRGGGEAVMQWQAHPKAVIDASVEYVLSYNVEDGTYLPWTPPLRTEAALDYILWNKRRANLSLRPSAVFTAQQKRTARNESATEGYALANISLRMVVPFGRHELHFSAFVHNLLDQRYIDHMSRYKLINLPEAGRNFGFALRYEFNSKS